MLEASLLALLTACSSTPSQAPDDASTQTDADDGGVGCLFCNDASIDAPLGVRVKGKIDQICANADGCHGGSAGMMGLGPGNEFAPMIDVTSFENPPMKRVLPFDPAHSYVYLKLACEGGIDGGCMPLGSPTDPALVQLFHDWIEAGAPTE